MKKVSREHLQLATKYASSLWREAFLRAMGAPQDYLDYEVRLQEKRRKAFAREGIDREVLHGAVCFIAAKELSSKTDCQKDRILLAEEYLLRKHGLDIGPVTKIVFSEHRMSLSTTKIGATKVG